MPEQVTNLRKAGKVAIFAAIAPCDGTLARSQVQVLSRFDPRHAVTADLAAVDACIHARLDSEVVLVRQVADYIIGSGGKRLRPILVLLVAGAFGPVGARVHMLAAVVEMIHTATLLHDDVVDESDLRRGRRTANAMFGNAASVLVGDFLYSRAFQMMVDIADMRVMRVLADATNTIAEGEVLQLMNIGDAETSEESYLKVVRYKTAKLFEAAGRAGAMISGAPDAACERMAEFGMRLGTAFQLIDDVLDYSGDVAQTGKNLGDDLLEGKPTLPLLRVLACGSAEQKEVVRRAITHPGEVDFGAVLEAIRATAALEYATAAAREESMRAAKLLDVLPEGGSRQTLLELCSFAVERTN